MLWQRRAKIIKVDEETSTLIIDMGDAGERVFKRVKTNYQFRYGKWVIIESTEEGSLSEVVLNIIFFIKGLKSFSTIVKFIQNDHVTLYICLNIITSTCG